MRSLQCMTRILCVVLAGCAGSGSVAGPVTSGLSCWFDAGSLALADGVTVFTWEDLSRSGHDAAQTGASFRPVFRKNVVNDLPVVRFDGVDDVLNYDGAFLAGTDYTVFVVEARNSSGDNYLLGGSEGVGDSNLHLGYRSDTVFTHAQWARDYDMTVAPFTSKQFKVHSFHLNSTGGGGRETYTDGARLGGDGTTVQLLAYNGAMIGGNVANRFEGDLAEILIYDRYLNAAERNRTGYYLAEKYALTTEYTDPAAADVAVSISASRATASSGDGIDYVITVVNHGFTNASAVAVAHTLPPHINYASHFGGNYNVTNGLWTIGDLAYLATTTLTVRAAVTASARGTLTISSVSLQPGAEADPDPANDQDSAHVRIRTEITPASFTHRARIEFPGYTGMQTLTNFPALVVLNESRVHFDYDQFASDDGHDLRFTASDGVTMLFHDIETWNPMGDSIVWVQVDEMAVGAAIYAYWGNTNLIGVPGFERDGYTWEEGFSGVWHMTEVHARDSSPNANHGTAGGYNGVSLTDGQIGSGAFFDGGSTVGAQAYIDVPNSDSLRMGDTFTFSAWVRWERDDNTGYGRIVSKKTGWDHGSGWHLTHLADNATNLDVRGSADMLYRAYDVAVWTNHNWEHVTAVYDGATATLYSRGQRVGSGTIIPVVDADVPLVFGNNASHNEWNWPGTMDEIRLADALRSPKWIHTAWLTAASNAAFTSYGAVVGAPVIGNLAATNVTDVSAFMNGTLSFTAGETTTVYLVYSWTGGSVTNVLGAFSAPVGLSEPVAGLVPATTYTYTYFASNVYGVVQATPGRVFMTRSPSYWTITPLPSPHGAIMPGAPQAVDAGSNSPLFSFTPDDGYSVTNVLVDGTPVGAVSSYQFTNVIANHTIQGLYGINQYTITVTQAPGGLIVPGTLTVDHGLDARFSLTPEDGNYLVDLLVDGQSVGPAGTYLLERVTARHTLTAVFTNLPIGMVTNSLVLWLDGAALAQASASMVTNWYDYSGQGNHARQLNDAYAPHVYDTDLGRHVRFNGTNEYMTVMHEEAFDFTTEVTIVLVGSHYGPGAAAWSPFIAKNGEPSGWQFREYGANNRLSFTTRGLTGGNTDDPFGVGDIQSNAILAARYDGATLTKRMWYNGRSDGTLTYGGGQISVNDDPVTLGADYNEGLDRFAQCDIYELLVYARALTDSELNAIGYYLDCKYGIDSMYFDPGLPRVRATGTSARRTTSVTLGGMLVSTGSAPTSIWAYWDQTDKGTNAVAWKGSAALGPQSLGRMTVTASGLQGDTEYVYRFFASNVNGTAWSDAWAFESGVVTEDHTHALKVRFSGYTGTSTLTNFPVLVTLSQGVGGFDYATFASRSGGDLRFTDAALSRTLNYEVDTWGNSLAGTSIGPDSGGHTTHDGDVYVVGGSGNDVWGKTDSFHYAWTQLEGDGGLTVRVASYDNPGGNAWAKAGPMIRETLEADSPFVFLALRPTDGAAWQYRDATAADADWRGSGSAGAAPRWLRLERSGQVFRGYTSNDGAAWLLEDQRTIEMTTNVYIGLAVCSHVVGNTTTVTYDNLSMTGTLARAQVWVQVPELSGPSDYVWALWGNSKRTTAPTYTTNGSTWADTFAGVWHLRETDALDSTVHANHGVAGGSVGVRATGGRIGAAAGFQGGSGGLSYIDLPGAGNLKMGAAFTVTTWARWDVGSTTGWGRLASKKSGYGDNNGWHVGHWDGNDTGLHIRGAGGTEFNANAVDSWMSGRWHHVAVIFDGTTCRVYGDGGLTQSGTVGAVADGDLPLVLGNNASHGEWNWGGMIDEFRVAPVVRSSDWIQASYSNQTAGSTFLTITSEVAVPPRTGILIIVR